MNIWLWINIFGSYSAGGYLVIGMRRKDYLSIFSLYGWFLSPFLIYCCYWLTSLKVTLYKRMRGSFILSVHVCTSMISWSVLVSNNPYNPGSISIMEFPNRVVTIDLAIVYFLCYMVFNLTQKNYRCLKSKPFMHNLIKQEGKVDIAHLKLN